MVLCCYFYYYDNRSLEGHIYLREARFVELISDVRVGKLFHVRYPYGFVTIDELACA